MIKQGNDPKSAMDYFIGIVGSLVEWDRKGESPGAKLFKEIADSQHIQGTLTGYRRVNPVYKRQRIPFKGQWLTVANKHIFEHYQTRKVSVKVPGEAKKEIMQMSIAQIYF
jgi:hypothetical protein